MPDGRVDHAELERRLNEQLKNLPVGSRWDHVASGKQYRVVMLSIREEDLVMLVTYEDLESRVRWTRTLSEFTNKFKWRFTR